MATRCRRPSLDSLRADTAQARARQRETWRLLPFCTSACAEAQLLDDSGNFATGTGTGTQLQLLELVAYVVGADGARNTSRGGGLRLSVTPP